MDVIVSRKRLRNVLFGAFAAVASAGVIVELLGALLGLKRRSGILPLLSLSHERNLPTLYTALLLVLCALATTIAALGVRQKCGKFAAYWWALAAGFSYIAVDEILMIHEAAHAIPVLVAGPSLRLRGALHFAWVIPAAILVLGVAIAFIPFLRHLDKPTRYRFLLAGAVYVGGAVGMELPLGWWVERAGQNTLGYALIDAVEESLEMLGLNLFLLAMVRHFIATESTLRFSSGDESGQKTAAIAEDLREEQTP